MGLVFAFGLILVAAAFVVAFVFLGRTRPRVMRYHDIDTPRINEMNHGGGGA